MRHYSDKPNGTICEICVEVSIIFIDHSLAINLLITLEVYILLIFFWSKVSLL